MKKRVILTVCLCALSLSLAACTEESEPAASSGIASAGTASDLSVPKASSDLLEVFSEEQVSSKEASSANTQTAAVSSQKAEASSRAVSSQTPPVKEDPSSEAPVSSAPSAAEMEEQLQREAITKVVDGAINLFITEGTIMPYLQPDSQRPENDIDWGDTLKLDDDLTTLCFQNFSYQITDIRIAENWAYAVIDIRNIDLASAISGATSAAEKFMQAESRMPENERLSQSELAAAISNIYRKRFLKADMVNYMALIDLVKEDDQWYLADEVRFADAMFGGQGMIR